MAVTDFANPAAAVAGGYRKTQIDRGAGVGGIAPAPRFQTIFDKPVTGATGDSGQRFEAFGDSTVDAATADTNALAALNAQRRHRYGGSAGRASAQAESNTSRGGVHTVDLT